MREKVKLTSNHKFSPEVALRPVYIHHNITYIFTFIYKRNLSIKLQNLRINFGKFDSKQVDSIYIEKFSMASSLDHYMIALGQLSTGPLHFLLLGKNPRI